MARKRKNFGLNEPLRHPDHKRPVRGAISSRRAS